MENYFALIDYLRRHMIYDAPLATDLKIQLDKDLTDLKFHEEKLKYLIEIKKLRDHRNIDRVYIGGILDFFNYAESKLRVEENSLDKNEDWSWLYKNLIGKYIKDISLNDFNVVMNYHKRPYGDSKIKWNDKRTHGAHFQKFFKFTMKEFNDCFVHKDGKGFLEHDRISKFTDQSFIDLLEVHK
jgi:hypothetical protein